METQEKPERKRSGLWKNIAYIGVILSSLVWATCEHNNANYERQERKGAEGLNNHYCNECIDLSKQLGYVTGQLEARNKGLESIAQARPKTKDSRDT